MQAEELITNSAIAAVVTDPRQPDNPIVACNDAFVSLTGYTRDEILGQNCRFLRGPDTEPWQTETLRTAIARKRPTMVEILNYKKDGSPFRNAVMISPIFDDSGELAYYIGSQIELAADSPNANEPRREYAYNRVSQLSPRQREVLVEMCQGQMNKQIAFKLDLTERTVKMHRSAMIDSLGVKTTAEAIRIAVEAGY
jgi:PAS domain S-box-containing protein